MASYSNHKTYQEALKWTRLYVNVSLAYGILLLAGAVDVLGRINVFSLEIREIDLRTEEIPKRRAAALSLATAGLMGLLVAAMVGRCCRFDRDRSCVMANWHDLFKYTHMGRAIVAAMTAVLTWRGLGSLQFFETAGGGVGRVPTVMIAAAALSMATAGVMHFTHFRIKSAHAEHADMRRRGATKVF